MADPGTNHSGAVRPRKVYASSARSTVTQWVTSREVMYCPPRDPALIPSCHRRRKSVFRAVVGIGEADPLEVAQGLGAHGAALRGPVTSGEVVY